MTVDIFGRVLINDGEGIDPDDLTGIGSRVLAVLWDQIVSSMLPNVPSSSDPSFNDAYDPTTSLWAFALTIAGARPVIGSANNKIKITKGTLLQAIGAPDGAEPQLLAFRFDGTDEVTIANGSVANPRVDIIQMKLEYVNDTPTSRDFQDAVSRALTTTTPTKRRRVKCTLSVKQGTPAASPQYPLPDTGFVAIAGVVVGTSWVAAAPMLDEDTTGANASIQDQRMPIGVATHAVFPLDAVAFFFDNAGFTLGWHALDALGAGNPAYGSYDVIAPGIAGTPLWATVKNAAGRCVQVSSASRINSGAPIISLAKFLLDATNINAGGGPSRIDIAFLNVLKTVTAVPTRKYASIVDMEQASFGTGPVVQFNGNLGPPIWTSGRRCPRDPRTLPAASIFETLCMYFEKSDTQYTVGPVTFWIAKGL